MRVPELKKVSGPFFDGGSRSERMPLPSPLGRPWLAQPNKTLQLTAAGRCAPVLPQLSGSRWAAL